MRERGPFLEFDQPGTTHKAMISPKQVTCAVEQDGGLVAINLLCGSTITVIGDRCEIADALERFYPQ